MQSGASSFNLQYPLFSLRSSSSCLHLLLHLPVTSILLSVFPSITCFRRQFLCKKWPILLAILLSVVGYSCLPWLFVTLFHFSHDWSNWSPSFYSTTFQNFPDISDLLFELSEFQHHMKLYSKCSILLVTSLNVSPICWWRESFSC
jgi:hypothetical protein